MDDALFQENERTAPDNQGQSVLSVGPLKLDGGSVLDDVEIAYRTYGALNQDRSNAILICHALSGDANCGQWWERMIGPGKAIDTERYFVIGTNALGGCQGSTGPLSSARDGEKWGSRFPQVTVPDMVRAQGQLLTLLGVDQLLMVAGGSMGGMQAIEWAVQFPARVKKVWMTASCARHSAMQIGFNETARQAVLRDPEGGLAVARMVGHLSYLSEAAFERKFGRARREDGVLQVASYLAHQGDKFVARFDPWSLVILSQAIDDYDCQSLEGASAEFLLTSFTSDWLYPSWQSREVLRMARAAGLPAQWHEIDLPHGHDAFLLDGEIQGAIVREFLEKE